MARLRDPRRAARARPLRRGPARRRLDGRRRAVVAGDGRRALLRRGRSCRGAATSSSAGRCVCYRPYACADGWVTLGALEPKFWQAWCHGRRARGPGRAASSSAPGSEAHREVEAIFPARTRDEWRAFASEHDCCLEPVLELDEALDSELVRAREMVVELDQPGRSGRCGCSASRSSSSRTPGDADRAPGPGLGEHTSEVLRGARLRRRRRSPRCWRRGAVGGAGRPGAAGSFLS